jgi:hypothetical protein
VTNTNARTQVKKQKLADKLLRASLKCERLDGKISGVRIKRLKEEDEEEAKRRVETKIDMSGDSCVLSSKAEDSKKRKLNFNIFRAMSAGARAVNRSARVVRDRGASMLRAISPGVPFSPSVDDSTSSSSSKEDGGDDDDIGLDGIELSDIQDKK